MTWKILVLGGGGMLGGEVCRRLGQSGDFKVEWTQRQDPDGGNFLDVEKDPMELERILAKREYQYVINAIGILASEINANDACSVERAIRVNALFPHILAQQACGMGVKVIHVSTDGVFSQQSERRLLETDLADASDVYGKTKSLGESPMKNVLNIRCSIIGMDPVRHKGLWEWFLGRPEKSEVPGYCNHFWNGVTTGQFSKLCETIIRQGFFDAMRAEGTVHHFCPNPPLSKYELLENLRRVSGKHVQIVPTEASQPVKRLLGTCRTVWPGIFETEGDWMKILSDFKDLKH